MKGITGTVNYAVYIYVKLQKLQFFLFLFSYFIYVYVLIQCNPYYLANPSSQ